MPAPAMYCPNCGVLIPPEAKFCPQCGKPAPQPDADASPPKLSEPAPVVAQPTTPFASAEDVDPKRPTTLPATKANTRKARIGRFIATAAAILCLVFGLLMMITAPITFGLKLWALVAELGLAFAVWKRSRIRIRTLLVLVVACTVLFFVLLGLGTSEREARLRAENGSQTSKEEDPLDQVVRLGLQLIPQHPENLIGSWKGTGPKISLTVEVTFTESEFRMLGRPDEGRDWVIEGPYTVDNSSWPMKITVSDGDRKHYFAVAIREQDKMDLEEIESPDDPLNADSVSKLLRMQ